MSNFETTKVFEVAIVGAGPIGIELALCLKRAGIDYVHLEAKQIGYTMTWWPRDTLFFSTTERIEIGCVPIQTTTQQRTSGEEYLAYLRSIVEQFDLEVRTYEPVVGIERQVDGFLLTTQPQTGKRHYLARKVVLASGDMHKPNRLNIPGEDLPHVSHYFHDVHPYFRKRLLIVGGRNSAAEAALRCWRAGAQVTLSYRKADFSERQVKHWILPDLRTQIELGTIGFHPLTRVAEITPGGVVLEHLRPDGECTGERFVHETDFVLLLTGYEADMTLFQVAGVGLLGENQTPCFNPQTMETDVPGLYVVGTAAAGRRQEKYGLFIENTHVHVGKVVRELTGQWPAKLGTIASRHYELELEDFEAN